LVIRPDDVLILESGGGGGWGDATQRDPAAVASDIENGFVMESAVAPHPGLG
jgi:N-methylhydantoinase B